MTELALRPGVVEVISKVDATDPGTADFLAEMLLYEALCEEVDRVRPALEKDARAVMKRQAETGLRALAKRYPAASPAERSELAKRAEQLYAVVEVAKDATQEDDPATPWWDKKGPDGKYVARASGQAGSFRRNVMDALKLFTGQRDRETAAAAGQKMEAIASGGRYERARALGNALVRTGDATGSPAVRTAGRLAQVAGDIGPEAERVFGRGLTRLAYRYRGTERRPDPKITEVARVAAAEAVKPTNAAGDARPGTPDQRRLYAVGEVGVLALRKQIPDPQLAALSLAAGRIPPSRGLMFDAQGRVVTEAVGFNGDHYLPFDLKNVKRLQGGQYVRTRTTGGLTDEDVYTGLLAGARQVQVVSNSGVFTLEFDPGLRGGRRYSDKARQMVSRYAKIIDKVASEQVTAQDLPPREVARIRADAVARARGNPTLAESYVKNDLQKAREMARFSGLDEEEAWEQATMRAQAELDQRTSVQGNKAATGGRVLYQRQREIFNEVMAEQRDKAVRNYRLDGEGYEAAQQALAQEFPYFIRSTKYEPLAQFLDRKGALRPEDPRPRRPGRDTGYTRRGQLQPDSLGSRNAERTPAEVPAGPRETATRPDAARTASSPTTRLSFEQMLRDPGSPVTRELTNTFAESLDFFNNLEEEAYTQHAGDETDKNAHRLLRGMTYLSWLVNDQAGGDMRKAAQFLARPDTEVGHLDRTADALGQLKRAARSDDRYEPEAFDRAADMLRKVKAAREPYASGVSSNPTLADPGQDPRPQPFKDIVELQGDMKALVDYAASDPEVASYATAFMLAGDEQAATAISEEARRLNALSRWPKDDAGLPDPSRVPPGLQAGDHPSAVDLHTAGAEHPDVVNLERMQKGWTLARTITLQSFLTGEELPKLNDAAQGGDSPLGQVVVSQRAPRSRVTKVHGPGSPAARALAARRSRSARPDRLPAYR